MPKIKRILDISQTTIIILKNSIVLTQKVVMYGQGNARATSRGFKLANTPPVNLNIPTGTRPVEGVRYVVPFMPEQEKKS